MVLQEKRRAERAEQQRIRAERDKERQARREVGAQQGRRNARQVANLIHTFINTSVIVGSLLEKPHYADYHAREFVVNLHGV